MEAGYTIGSAVSCSDGACGKLTRVIINPVGRTLTHLVVEPDGDPNAARLVPAQLAEPCAPDEPITLRCSRAQFGGLEYAHIEEFIPAEHDSLGYAARYTSWLPYYPLGGISAGPLTGPGTLAAISDPGPRVVGEDLVPTGEVQVRRRQPVHATDGDIGHVRGLVVEPDTGHVTHILLDQGHLWGKKTVGIPIAAVESVKTGIELNLSKDEIRDLPEIEIGQHGER